MKNILTRNAKAIFDLSTAEGVDVGVARDMFASNLSLYPELPHKGAKVDYVTLSAEWAGMTREEQAEAKTAFKELLRDHYHELGNAYAAGDRETFDRILEGFRHGA